MNLLEIGVEEEDLALEVNQSSKNLAAAPLLSQLMSLLFLLMEVPCVAYQLKAPMLFPLAPSTNFRRVIWVSTLYGYPALSSAGFNNRHLGFCLFPHFPRLLKDYHVIKRSNFSTLIYYFVSNLEVNNLIVYFIFPLQLGMC